LKNDIGTYIEAWETQCTVNFDLQATVLTNILMYEDLLLEKAVLPFLSNLDSELDR